MHRASRTLSPGKPPQHADGAEAGFHGSLGIVECIADDDGLGMLKGIELGHGKDDRCPWTEAIRCLITSVSAH